MVSAIRSGPRTARSGDPVRVELVAAHPRGKNSNGTRQDHVAQTSAPAQAASRSADRRTRDSGTLEQAHCLPGNAPQVNSGSMKSAGAGYRSTSRTTLPAPGHRIPPTWKYVSGLVFGTAGAAGH